MPVTYAARHVLEDHISGFEATPNPHHLAILRSPVIFSVLVHAGHERDIEDALNNLEDVHVRVCGPGEWLLVGESVTADTLARQLADIGASRVSFLDQSDGRVVLSLGGPHVRGILAKCTALDLHFDAFGIGQSTNCQICHVAANLARTGQDTFEIVVMRSFAGFLFDEVCEMGKEFALTAGFS
ncbi:sarcosine oxidase subunit gamma family protein [Rhizobium sp. AG855]|uniref:sarcosine oxidase subunit gamma n=1 Tax=Rhizobium sp. AG855 TaxID=2183898 RepID=UPI000E740CDF|nr:sarcosine oxidase subunit gamma family protein [Rhizobium sp. AG855]RKE83915.1 N-methylglutamate dehydrogenase subunit D [Rhizobium sp. AG855]